MTELQYKNYQTGFIGCNVVLAVIEECTKRGGEINRYEERGYKRRRENNYKQRWWWHQTAGDDPKTSIDYSKAVVNDSEGAVDDSNAVNNTWTCACLLADQWWSTLKPPVNIKGQVNFNDEN